MALHNDIVEVFGKSGCGKSFFAGWMASKFRERGKARLVIWDKKNEYRKLDAEASRRVALIYKEISDEAANYRAQHGLAAVFLYVPIEAGFETKKSDLDIFLEFARRMAACQKYFSKYRGESFPGWSSAFKRLRHRTA